ncbi:MAG: glycosyltransferase family A protein, partial [Desulfobacteraceae bacterium]
MENNCKSGLSTEQQLFISIIIPFLNAERTLKTCLDSIAAVNYQDFEVILVDDGSQDHSAEIAMRYPFRYFHNKSNKGAGAARNFGASKAKGDILLFLDADIIVQPDIVSRVRSTFFKDPTVSAVVGMYSKGTTETGFFSVYKNLENHYEHYSFNKPFFSFVAFAGAVRKEVFEDLKGFNEKFRGATVEDVEFGYRLSQAGYKSILDKQLLVIHQKKITFLKFVKSELIHRAIPWWILLLQRRELRLNPSIGINNILSVILFSLCFALIFIAPFFNQLQNLPVFL